MVKLFVNGWTCWQMVDVVRYTSIPSYWKKKPKFLRSTRTGLNSSSKFYGCVGIIFFVDEGVVTCLELILVPQSSFFARAITSENIKNIDWTSFGQEWNGEEKLWFEQEKAPKAVVVLISGTTLWPESDLALSWELCAFLKLLKLYASRSNGFQTTFGGHADRVSQMRSEKRQEAALRAWSTQTRSSSHFTGAAIGRPTILITSGRLAPGDSIRARVRMRVCAQDTWERLEEA